MRLSEHQAAFLLDFCKLVQYATSLGFMVTPGELQRTLEQQEIYFKKGRSKTMRSNHIRKLAGDLNFLKDGKLVYSAEELTPLGEYWCALNPLNRWGGNFSKFKDRPHFERNV